MCQISTFEFFTTESNKDDFEGKRILEVGSRYVNGSVRPFIERFMNPEKYVGVDIEKGLYVDEIVSAEGIIERFGKESFDTVITTDMMEHVSDWRLIINNIKSILKPDGVLYLTTCSYGFPLHNFPNDFWRFEIEDIKRIFSDFEIISLEKNPEAPGLFMMARKPKSWKASDLSSIELYSITVGNCIDFIPTMDQIPIVRKLRMKILASSIGQMFRARSLSILAVLLSIL